jgi:cardiolipin synthase
VTISHSTSLLSDLPSLPYSYQAAALLFLHVLLAGAVTIHLLRSRRVNRSAAGWVGLTWLAPVLGTVLYLLLGINRVRRRAGSLRTLRVPGRTPEALGETKREDHLSALNRSAARITQRAALAGNSIRVLHNGDESYPLMIEAIEHSSSSLALSCYLFRDDAIGRKFIDALTRAAQRGVSVCVIVDGFGSGYFSSAAYRHLRRNGVPAARFLHSSLPWRMPFLNLRCHKKLLVSDGRLAFTGGLNIGGENLIADRPKSGVLDTHFRVEGPIVLHLMRSFADDWFFTTGKELSGEAWFPTLTAQGPSTARVVTSGPDEDIEKIEFLMLEAIGCAQESVRIMTPYFAPDARLITALCLAALRGVAVELIVPQRSNHAFMDGAARATIGPLLEYGCLVNAHQLPFDHSKLMTVDSLWSLVGSANWDIRSLRLNFELDMELYCPVMAQRLNDHMDKLELKPITTQVLDSRSQFRVLSDGLATLLMPYL